MADASMRLEILVVGVADVERALGFYRDVLGFALDHDTRLGDDRLIQLTPPGSGCSIAIGTIDPAGRPVDPSRRVAGLQLVVGDLRAAHAELSRRGAPVGEVQVFDRGALRPAREGDRLDNVGFCFVADPDGNEWTFQQISGG